MAQKQQGRVNVTAGDDGIMHVQQMSDEEIAREQAADEAAAERVLMEAMQTTALPAILDAMWIANVLDIERTLKQVTQVVLFGGIYGVEAVPKTRRRVLARGLTELGQVFVTLAQKHQAEQADQGKVSAMDRMQQAAQAAQMQG